MAPHRGSTGVCMGSGGCLRGVHGLWRGSGGCALRCGGGLGGGPGLTPVCVGWGGVNGTVARRAPGCYRRRPTCAASSPGSSYDLTGPRDPISSGACSAALTPIPNACPRTPARRATVPLQGWGWGRPAVISCHLSCPLLPSQCSNTIKCTVKHVSTAHSGGLPPPP